MKKKFRFLYNIISRKKKFRDFTEIKKIKDKKKPAVEYPL